MDRHVAIEHRIYRDALAAVHRCQVGFAKVRGREPIFRIDECEKSLSRTD
jgi:hypothetical protein